MRYQEEKEGSLSKPAKAIASYLPTSWPQSSPSPLTLPLRPTEVEIEEGKAQYKRSREAVKASVLGPRDQAVKPYLGLEEGDGDSLLVTSDLNGGISSRYAEYHA